MSSPMTTAASAGLERDEYRTPPEIFEGLGWRFDLDVAAPTQGPWHVPADNALTREDDGLASKWHGFVWMNPPFGTRNGQVPWLKKFFEHGHGIGLVNALTSAGWFHDWMPKASGLLFPRGKTRFIRPDGSVAKQPANGIVLFSAGWKGSVILRDSKIDGIFVNPATTKVSRANG